MNVHPAGRRRESCMAGHGIRSAVRFLMLLFCVPALLGARAPQAGSGVAELEGKARALELRGRTELAREAWQQVLEQEPSNPDGLKGLIRTLQSTGHSQEAEVYLARLRAAHPEDSELAQLGRSSGNRETEQRQAEQLAREGKPSEATAIYRRLYGANPPAGEIALRYYAVEGATEEGRTHAIASLRALADRFPNDARYRRALGSLLVGNARTQAEGEKLLGGKPANRQMASATKPLLGRSDPPAAKPAPLLHSPSKSETQKTFVASEKTPSPAELTPEPVGSAVTEAPALTSSAAAVSAPPLPQPSSPATTTPLTLARKAPGRAEGAAASTPGVVPGVAQATAQGVAQGVTSSLAEEKPPVPVASGAAVTASPGVAASVREGANAVSATAVSLASGADPHANGAEERAGYAALKSGHLRDAELRFKVVLAREPENARALGGLGLLRLRQSAWNDAAGLLQQAAQNGDNDSAIGRGLEQARAAGGVSMASTSATRAPGGTAGQVVPRPRSLVQTSEVRAEPLALRSNASPGPRPTTPERRREAIETTIAIPPASAAHPAPASDAALVSPYRHTAEYEVQRAANLASQGDQTQAIALYKGIVAGAPESRPAWSGLIGLLHARGEDAEALKQLDAMPQGVLQASFGTPEFAVTAAAVEANQGRTEAARQVLEGLLSRAPQPAGRAYGPAQLGLAYVLLGEGRSAQAYGWFRAALANNLDNVEAWAGLLASLQASGHDRETLAQMDAVPALIRPLLETNGVFLQAATLAYAGVNEKAQAISYWDRLQQYVEANKVALPPTLPIEFAQWLDKQRDEAHLYPALMNLGARTDLTVAERRSIQRIWAAWALRQAVAQSRSGDAEKAKLTLVAAAAAFSDNPDALRTVARGYVSVNQPKAALAVYKAQDLTNADSEDMTAAINAALGARDMKNADSWLRNALPRFREDVGILLLASRFEQETGHRRESTAYLQAALARGPAGSASTSVNATPSGEQIASAEAPTGANLAPNLAEILGRGKTAEKGKADVAGSAAKGRPYLPGTEGPTAPVRQPAANGKR